MKKDPLESNDEIYIYIYIKIEEEKEKVSKCI